MKHAYLIIKIIVFWICQTSVSNFTFCNTPVYTNSLPTIRKEQITLILRRSDSLIAIGLYKLNIIELNTLMITINSHPDLWNRNANSLFTRLAGCYGEIGKFDSASIILKRQAGWIKKYGAEFLEYGKLCHNYARILSLTNSLPQAITANKIALLFKLLDKKKDIKSIISTYRELAFCYANTNNNFLAKKYYNLTLNYVDKLVPMDYDLKFSIVEKYAELLYNDGDYESVKNIYEEALEYKYGSKYAQVVNKILAYHNLSDLALRPLIEFDSALKYIETGSQLIKQYHAEDIISPIQFDLLKASIYYDKEDYTTAGSIYFTCYEQLKTNKNFDLKTKINLVYNLYKTCYKLKYYKKALEVLNIYESLNNTLFANTATPRTETELAKLLLNNSIDPQPNQLDSLYSIWKRAGVNILSLIPLEVFIKESNIEFSLETTDFLLTNLYQQFQTNTYLSLKLNNILNTLRYLDYLKSINAGDDISIKSDTKVQPLIENGISLAYDLYTKTKLSQYIDIALQLTEKNKSNQLLSAIKQAFHGDIPGLPVDLQKKERLITDNLRGLMVDRFKSSDTLQVKQSFDLIQSYRNLLETISSRYPEYFKHRYGIELIDIQDFKLKYLDDSISYISYYYAEKAVYMILLQKGNEHFIKLDQQGREELNSEIGKFNSIASQKPEEGNLQLIHDYQLLGAKLYCSLIKPIKSELKYNVVISPDGPLNSLPFDIIPASDKEEKDWNKIHYLLFDYNISYTSSLAVLKELKTKKRNTGSKTFLGIAYSPPPGNNLHLPALPFAEQELNQINHKLHGEVLKDNYSSKYNLLKATNDFQILHIAAHAKADNESGNKSFLVLAPDSLNKDGLVYAYDLYKYHLNNDLVVLSACESGAGENLKGEGVVGLTRAFLYAGAKCILPSLWKVSDFQVSQILPEFYQELSTGKNISNAMQKAKQKYISNTVGLYAHPFYWGGFVVIGEPGVINKPDLPISLILALGICLAFIIYKRKTILTQPYFILKK
ncbi:MAG TPA: CHAT domain-containing protein [Saprospiraceae bacterium]|nr:CHAT domain-containing protein [Saprospiraceae bacterium]